METTDRREITVARFAGGPTPMSRRDGEKGGARFRDDVLWPALRDGGSVQVSLYGIPGYSSSFLDEAFGGLVRKHPDLGPGLRSRLEIVGPNRNLIELIWEYIDRARTGGGANSGRSA